MKTTIRCQPTRNMNLRILATEWNFFTELPYAHSKCSHREKNSKSMMSIYPTNDTQSCPERQGFLPPAFRSHRSQQVFLLNIK